MVTFSIVLLAYGLVTVLGLTRSSQLAEAEKRAAQIDQELKRDKKLDETLQQYTALVAINENLAGLLVSRNLFLPNWETVKSTVPSDVQFTSVSVQDDQTFRISGEARSVSAIANFSKALSQKDGVSNIVPSSVNKKAEDNKFVFGVNFEFGKKGGVTQ